MIKDYIMVFLGGGVGSLLRFLISSFIGMHNKTLFPFGTLVVNIIGAFLIGLFVELAALKFSYLNQYKLLLITGFLGGFTTFSAFSLESSLMWQEGKYWLMALYILISVCATIASVLLAREVVRIAV